MRSLVQQYKNLFFLPPTAFILLRDIYFPISKGTYFLCSEKPIKFDARQSTYSTSNRSKSSLSILNAKFSLAGYNYLTKTKPKSSANNTGWQFKSWGQGWQEKVQVHTMDSRTRIYRGYFQWYVGENTRENFLNWHPVPDNTSIDSTVSVVHRQLPKKTADARLFLLAKMEWPFSCCEDGVIV